jgi:hypothetical protein
VLKRVEFGEIKRVVVESELEFDESNALLLTFRESPRKPLFQGSNPLGGWALGGRVVKAQRCCHTLGAFGWVRGMDLIKDASKILGVEGFMYRRF